MRCMNWDWFVMTGSQVFMIWNINVAETPPAFGYGIRSDYDKIQENNVKIAFPVGSVWVLRKSGNDYWCNIDNTNRRKLRQQSQSEVNSLSRCCQSMSKSFPWVNKKHHGLPQWKQIVYLSHWMAK